MVSLSMVNLVYLPQGVDIISSDLHGYSKKITDESEARENFMKQDQHWR